MRMLVTAVFAGVLAQAAWAEGISSAYTELRAARDCTTFDADGFDQGEFARLVCPGYRGYPVLLFASDLRQSLFYGFPPGDLDRLKLESFGSFNSTGGTIEWRISTHHGVSTPFAAIHRWYVADSPDSSNQIEILVVAKVAQPDSTDGCTVGLVLASGRPDALEIARGIADEEARDFVCGQDKRILVGGPMPEFDLHDRSAR